MDTTINIWFKNVIQKAILDVPNEYLINSFWCVVKYLLNFDILNWLLH